MNNGIWYLVLILAGTVFLLAVMRSAELNHQRRSRRTYVNDSPVAADRLDVGYCACKRIIVPVIPEYPGRELGGVTHRRTICQPTQEAIR